MRGRLEKRARLSSCFLPQFPLQGSGAEKRTPGRRRGSEELHRCRVLVFLPSLEELCNSLSYHCVHFFLRAKESHPDHTILLGGSCISSHLAHFVGHREGEEPRGLMPPPAPGRGDIRAAQPGRHHKAWWAKQQHAG